MCSKVNYALSKVELVKRGSGLIISTSFGVISIIFCMLIRADVLELVKRGWDRETKKTNHFWRHFDVMTLLTRRHDVTNVTLMTENHQDYLDEDADQVWDQLNDIWSRYGEKQLPVFTLSAQFFIYFYIFYIYIKNYVFFSKKRYIKYLDQNAEFLRQPTRNLIKFGHPLVSEPPNMSKYV